MMSMMPGTYLVRNVRVAYSYVVPSVMVQLGVGCRGIIIMVPEPIANFKL